MASSNVYEYTPPQPQLGGTNLGREGKWTYVPSCTPYAAPEGRYGHTLAYDTLNQSLILMGGYDVSGNPLTTTINYPGGGTYTMPEVWSGTYCADNTCGGKLTQNSVSITNSPCYYWQQITQFGNSIYVQSQVPPETGLSHSASVYIPATGYNSGYYAMFDQSCIGSGPVATADPSVNKLLAGGAYIDIDRTQLGTNENLLLSVTYIPLGTQNVNPDATQVTPDESAVFRVHLIKTGQNQTQLQSVLQPRYMTYASTTLYPEIAQSISVMAPPTGQIAQEQMLIPLSLDPGIDRIRIERLSGSGILLDATIYRMGTK